MTFAASLKKAREELGLTQQELSQLLHVSYSTMSIRYTRDEFERILKEGNVDVSNVIVD